MGLPTTAGVGPVVAAALVLAVAAPLTAQRHFPGDARLRQMAAPLLPDGAAIGMVIGVLEADGTRRVVAVGAPYDGRTVFDIASVTKVFTGILLAEMAGRGEVRLDEPVADLLPDSVAVPSRGRAITLLQLATHTSGLPPMPADFGGTGHANPFAGYTPARLYAFLESHELARDVGAAVEYSNLGFGLLGHALELRAGAPYGELLAERVLAPIGLSSTGVARDDSLGQRLAPPHGAGARPITGWSSWAGSAFTAAGALRSTADDLLTFLAWNLGPPDNALGDAIRLSHQVHYQHAGRGQSGLAWQIQDLLDSTVLWHNGRIVGYSSFIGFDPARRVGVVILTNSRAPIDMMGWHLLEPRFPLSTPTRMFALIGLALALCAVVAAGVAAAWRRTGRHGPRRSAAVAFAIGILWLALTVMAGTTWITVANGQAARAVAVLAGIAAAGVIGWSPIGRRLAAGLPLAVLVAAQAVRLPAELVLHPTYASGSVLPVLSYNGYTLDSVFAMLTLGMVLLVALGRAGHRPVQLWNGLGMLLLLNLVVLSLLNVWIGQGPFIWLPTVLLPFTLLAHVLVLRKLTPTGPAAPN
jgi:serine-type D-Ala-D-Ala carboxypeptidase/endopeptidase